MKKTALAAALLAASSAAQGATLEAGATYNVQILADGNSCFTFGDCTAVPTSAFVDNDADATAAAGSANPAFGSAIAGDTFAGIINITTSADGSGGVIFTVNSFNMDTYLGTSGGAFATMAADTSAMTGSVDANGNIAFDPTGRTGMAQFFNVSLGEQLWNQGSTFTSGNQTNAVANLTGSTLSLADGTASIVSASAVANWGFFEGTPYTEVFSIKFVGTSGAAVIPTPPTANDDTSISIDQGTSNNTLSVLSNDTSEGTITIDSVTGPTSGTLTGFTAGDTTLQYNPPADDTVQTDSITYTITDGFNTDTATVSININDKTVPVIALNGLSSITLQVGDTYNEAGASCTDNFDATQALSGPATIVGTVSGSVGSVDTSQVQNFTLTYQCTDAASNAAVDVTRTVVVQSAPVTNVPPTITLIGTSPMDVTVGTTFVDPGANCNDPEDGISAATATIPSGTIDTSTLAIIPGAVQYNCTDSDGDPAPQVSRRVDIVDDVAPVITPTGDNPTKVVKDSSYVELGANCVDNFDTNPALVISPAANTVDTSALGNTATITYTCTDAESNQTITTIDVITVSAIPTIALNGNNPITQLLGQPYSELGASCTDDLDADSDAIVSGDTVDTTSEGTYTVRYNCSDSDGNNATEVTRTVIISLDTEAPTITLNGEASISLNKDFVYFEDGAICSDNADADKSASVSGDTVDTSTPGTYIVEYTCVDFSNNPAVPKTRTVTINSISASTTATSSSELDDELGVGSLGWWLFTSLFGLLLLRRNT